MTDELRTLIRAYKPELVRLLSLQRPIIEYRFADDPPDRWYIMLGRPGESYETAAAACRRQFDHLVDTRLRETRLPAGFPFSSPCPDCDGSGCDTCGEGEPEGT